MNEAIKSSNEKIPNEREVLNQVESVVEGPFDFVEKFEDEEGLYKLDVYTKDEAGDTVLHTYMRAGNYGKGPRVETAIDVFFYSGDIPVGGHLVMKYENGEWVKETR